ICPLINHFMELSCRGAPRCAPLTQWWAGRAGFKLAPTGRTHGSAPTKYAISNLPIIPVGGGAGPFAGDHAGSHWLGGGAGLLEEGTLPGTQHPAQHLAAAARRGFYRRGQPRPNLGKPGAGVKAGVGLANLHAAAGNDSQTAPVSVAGVKTSASKAWAWGLGWVR